MLSAREQREAYAIAASYLQAKALVFAEYRRRDIADCAIGCDDLAQDALARHWQTLGRVVERKRIATSAEYLAQCFRLRLRFRRRPFGWQAPETIAPHYCPVALRKLERSLDRQAYDYCVQRLAGASAQQACLALYGYCGGSQYGELEKLASRIELLARLVLS